MRRTFLNILHHIGLTIKEDPRTLSKDLDRLFAPIWRKTRNYTMTSTDRMFALYKAVEYISQNHISGDIVECGVWRGGSAMICAYTLKTFRDTNRTIYLYDTYSGMPEPGMYDRTVLGNNPAHKIWKLSLKEAADTWCYATLKEVKKNLYRTKYPKTKIRFIEGKVEDTIPAHAPRRIALLRLDTDWYSSTYHELLHLYPRLVPGGVLIIDDYGHWKGAQKAVDTYFWKHKAPILFNRIDYTGRIAIKPV